MEPGGAMCFSLLAVRPMIAVRRPAREDAMTLGTILIILVIIYLLGGMSGRFGGYGYGMGHSGMGIGGLVLVVLIVLLLLGKL
jgi:Protein of unknown function (DUF3309)